MPILKVVDLDRRKTNSCFLESFRENVNSQFGEDGIIRKIMEIVKPANKWCVEFGAWDGIHLSNTRHLVKDLGWNGVMIEGNSEKYSDLEENYKDMPNAHLRKAIVGYEKGINTLDSILATTGAPKDIDVASIDIDGNDYYIWQSLVDFRPRLVVIEFNPTIPNDVIFVQDQDMAIHQGCSLRALIELGKRRRYELVATTNCNAFFVPDKLFPKFNISDNSIDAMRANVTGRIFHTYDGTVYNKMRPLQWAGRGAPTPAIDQFQILTQEQRTFYDKLGDGLVPSE